MQLPLPIHGIETDADPTNQRREAAWRPIHYLGSKLRVLDSIQAALDEVEPSGLPVCDLFSGSGTVAAALGTDRDVISVDVQEYARVLCSALLSPADIDPGVLVGEAHRAMDTSMLDGLAWAAATLIEHETECLQHARSGELEPLCELIEAGSIITYQVQKSHRSLNGPLQKAIDASIARLTKIGLVSSRRSMAFRHFGGIYFSYKQAVEIDLLLDVVENQKNIARDTVLASLLRVRPETL